MSHVRTFGLLLFIGSICFPISPVEAQGIRLFRGRARPTRPAREVSAEEVRNAISNGVRALEDRQSGGGTWKNVGDVENGATALCTLALLNASERKDSPAILKGIDAVLKERNRRTYFLALRIMCLATADPAGKKYLQKVQEDVDWLQKVQSNDGGWAYGRTGKMRASDSSNTQFALLALHEASQMGAVVKEETWQRVKKYWENCRVRGGGYGYSTRDNGTRLTMAAAGLASSIIIDENLPDLTAMFDGANITCCGTSDAEDHEKLTVEYIGRNFSLLQRQWRYYLLYGLERAGRLSGRRFFGAHDWYREGSARLVDTQANGNSWTGSSSEDINVASAMSLLFLSKGKRPIAIGKYLFEDDNDLLHDKGVHYLTRNLEKAWGQKLNWQEVKGPKATIEDLLETPVLFMSGNGAFVLTDFQKENLKKYLENGGFLFADACQGEGCAPAKFDLSFRALMNELFPDSPMELLPTNHPIWTSHYSLKFPDRRPLWGVRACCKTSVVYCPRNLACLWNADRPGVVRKMEAAGAKFGKLLDDIQYSTKVGVNVVTYATGRELREKGDRPKLAGNAVSVLEGRSLEAAKLFHGGGHDEAPNAWRNIQKKFAQTGVSVNFNKKFVSAELQQLGDSPFLFVHGRNAFSFTEKERFALKTYLTQMQGFIFADSICSSPEFTESFRKEMELILGQPLKPIPPKHPIWNDRRYLYKIDRVTLRKKRGETGKYDEIVGPPELEGHEIDDRLVVVFSPHDLSCAMESPTVSQCDGYKREDAERIGVNVLLYRLRVD